jgi:hypothetical protein
MFIFLCFYYFLHVCHIWCTVYFGAGAAGFGFMQTREIDFSLFNPFLFYFSLFIFLLFKTDSFRLQQPDIARGRDDDSDAPGGLREMGFPFFSPCIYLFYSTFIYFMRFQ